MVRDSNADGTSGEPADERSEAIALERRITELEERNAEIEEELQENSGFAGMTRRSALGILGGGALLGTADSASARGRGKGRKGKNGGPPFYNWREDVDAGGHDLANLGALGMANTASAVTDLAGENLSIDDGVLNASGGSSGLVSAAKNGYIQLIASGEGAGTIDPEEHEQPVQTAIDRVDAAGGGTVLLPPGTTVTENGTVNMVRGTDLLGYGSATSTLKTTATGVAGINITGADYTTLDGINLVGPGETKSTGPAILVDNSGAANDITIGTLRIKHWADSALRTGKFWSSKIEHLRIAYVDAGDADGLIELDGAGPPIHINLIQAYPTHANSGKNSDILYAKGTGPLVVDQLNIGGSAGRALDLHGGGHGRVHLVRTLNYEPEPNPSNLSAGRPTEIVNLDAADTFIRIDSLYTVDYGIRELQDPDSFFGTVAQYAYTLQAGERSNILAPPDGVGRDALEKNVINVAGPLDPSGKHPSYYFGPTEDVDNNTDSAQPGLRCLATAGTAPSAPAGSGDGTGDVTAYSVPKQSLTVDGNLEEVSNLSGLSIGEDFTGYDGGTHTNGGTAWWAWDSEYLYLVADLADDDHVQDQKPSAMFRDDAIQAGVSSGKPGEASNWDAFTIGLRPEGPTVYHAVFPDRDSPGVLKSADASIVRENGHTRYEIGLPWDALTASSTDEFVSLSLAIHDTDSDSEPGWVRWADGILGGKNNALYKPAELTEN